MVKNAAVMALVALLVVGVALAGFLVVQNQGYASGNGKAAEPAQRQFSILNVKVSDEPYPHYRFVPGTIVVNKGDTVILRVTNADAEGSHGFSIPGYSIDKRGIQPGTTETFQFVADKSGIFGFACSEVGCTEDHNDQTGQLVVLE